MVKLYFFVLKTEIYIYHSLCLIHFSFYQFLFKQLPFSSNTEFINCVHDNKHAYSCSFNNNGIYL